jgi:hypothetical protein
MLADMTREELEAVGGVEEENQRWRGAVWIAGHGAPDDGGLCDWTR